MCSASTNLAASCLASSTNWRTTTTAVSRGTKRWGRRSTVRNLSITPPQVYPGGEEPPEMLLVYGLAGHAEGFGDLGPCPALAHRTLDFGVLEPVGHRSE